jgi:hypothetical protein
MWHLQRKQTFLFDADRPRPRQGKALSLKKNCNTND